MAPCGQKSIAYLDIQKNLENVKYVVLERIVQWTISSGTTVMENLFHLSSTLDFFGAILETISFHLEIFQYASLRERLSLFLKFIEGDIG